MKPLTIHHTRDPNATTAPPDSHQDTYSKTVLGFWIYLMTDCLLFASFFATYVVLHESTASGPSSQELFSLSTAFIETMILLFSSVSCGFAMLAAVKSQKNQTIAWLAVTFILGLSFLAIEGHEFFTLVQEGNSWSRSAFLSAFFSLVGTHGLHISVGLLWMATMIGQLTFSGITIAIFRRLVIFSMFWHFLDLIWIFIFTFVYLMGVI